MERKDTDNELQYCIAKVIRVSQERRGGGWLVQKRVQTPHGEFNLPEETPNEAGEHILVKYYPQDQFATPVSTELVVKAFEAKRQLDEYIGKGGTI
jgi:hypothetical protein